MSVFSQESGKLIWESGHERIYLQTWGKDGLRIQSTRNKELYDMPHALLTPTVFPCTVSIEEKGATIQNGKILGKISSDGHMTFTSMSTGALLLEEEPLYPTHPPARHYKPLTGDNYHIDVKFITQPNEHFYGLGQHSNGYLDQKGCVIELTQRNTNVSIPFLVSSRGYGFLWNNPAVGRVELGKDLTHWVAEGTTQVDYYITCGDSYADIMERYADATGHPLMLPEFATGFWQCKLRYLNQEELLSVAREYTRRGLPLSVIVIDFFHWTKMGDWKFEPRDWPDPAAMVRELDQMGVKLMVSIWPTVNANSKNFAEMDQKGYLVRTDHGASAVMGFEDTDPKGRSYLHYYDPTHPGARKFVWEQVRENYYRYGIKVWWLDACEPEIYTFDVENLRYHLGNGLQVSNLYPLMHAQGFYDGMRAEGETEIIHLARSAWAGSQRFGAAVWSGDINSTFESLRAQIKAGLNIALSGIPWWTTDIGGFVGGDITTSYFKELVVRWFQYGVFCPLFRLHGVRAPFPQNQVGVGSGGPNEIWSFGDEAYEIIKELLFLRERMKPYLMAQMRLAHEKGIPPMRPLFFDFASDNICYTVEDQFMLGPDVMVVPVVNESDRSRTLYLPAGCQWEDAWTGKATFGGQWVTVDTPIEKVPVYFRAGTHPFKMVK